MVSQKDKGDRKAQFVDFYEFITKKFVKQYFRDNTDPRGRI